MFFWLFLSSFQSPKFTTPCHALDSKRLQMPDSLPNEALLAWLVNYVFGYLGTKLLLSLYDLHVKLETELKNIVEVVRHY